MSTDDHDASRPTTGQDHRGSDQPDATSAPHESSSPPATPFPPTGNEGGQEGRKRQNSPAAPPSLCPGESAGSPIEEWVRGSPRWGVAEGRRARCGSGNLTFRFPSGDYFPGQQFCQSKACPECRTYYWLSQQREALDRLFDVDWHYDRLTRSRWAERGCGSVWVALMPPEAWPKSAWDRHRKAWRLADGRYYAVRFSDGRAVLISSYALAEREGVKVVEMDSLVAAEIIERLLRRYSVEHRVRLTQRKRTESDTARDDSERTKLILRSSRVDADEFEERVAERLAQARDEQELGIAHQELPLIPSYPAAAFSDYDLRELAQRIEQDEVQKVERHESWDMRDLESDDES